MVKTAQRITGAQLPSIQDIYHKRCLGRVRNIIKDVSHPSHSLFTPLPSSRRYRSLRSSTSRLRKSFFSWGCDPAEFCPVTLLHPCTFCTAHVSYSGPTPMYILFCNLHSPLTACAYLIYMHFLNNVHIITIDIYSYKIYTALYVNNSVYCTNG